MWTVCSGKHIRGVTAHPCFAVEHTLRSIYTQGFLQIWRFFFFPHFSKTQIKMMVIIIVLSIVTLLSDIFVSLSGFIYLRNKQGTEYCKATAHISNSSPLVFFDFSFFSIVCFIPTICSYFNDHFESYRCMLVWLGLNSLILWLYPSFCVVGGFYLSPGYIEKKFSQGLVFWLKHLSLDLIDVMA